MNRAALISSQVNPIHIRASLFHSSPILERRRRTHWDSGKCANNGSSRIENDTVFLDVKRRSVHVTHCQKNCAHLVIKLCNMGSFCWNRRVSAYMMQFFWKSFFSRRYRKHNSRQALFESVNGFAEQFFQFQMVLYNEAVISLTMAWAGLMGIWLLT
ncbi:hypothetical protein MTR67_012737 [Solanum verrucosum]|uniref:Uncharacterized protein n=1 Tax=Solanum verrucosum TaxID=315347 RepID=A0AAF0QAD2_SOLVR|nr:hypothetical protein MTR67_012737 [Solanum verrucosum]